MFSLNKILQLWFLAKSQEMNHFMHTYERAVGDAYIIKQAGKRILTKKDLVR